MPRLQPIVRQEGPNKYDRIFQGVELGARIGGQFDQLRLAGKRQALEEKRLQEQVQRAEQQADARLQDQALEQRRLSLGEQQLGLKEQQFAQEQAGQEGVRRLEGEAMGMMGGVDADPQIHAILNRRREVHKNLNTEEERKLNFHLAEQEMIHYSAKKLGDEVANLAQRGAFQTRDGEGSPVDTSGEDGDPIPDAIGKAMEALEKNPSRETLALASQAVDSLMEDREQQNTQTMVLEIDRQDAKSAIDKAREIPGFPSDRIVEAISIFNRQARMEPGELTDAVHKSLWGGGRSDLKEADYGGATMPQRTHLDLPYEESKGYLTALKTLVNRNQATAENIDEINAQFGVNPDLLPEDAQRALISDLGLNE